MTITSFDNGVPKQFYQDPTLQGRLKIFLRYVTARLLKREPMSKELEKVSFMASVDDPVNGEMYYDGQLQGYIKLLPMTKDFIFKQ